MVNVAKAKPGERHAGRRLLSTLYQPTKCGFWFNAILPISRSSRFVKSLPTGSRVCCQTSALLGTFESDKNGDLHHFDDLKLHAELVGSDKRANACKDQGYMSGCQCRSTVQSTSIRSSFCLLLAERRTTQHRRSMIGCITQIA